MDGGCDEEDALEATESDGGCITASAAAAALVGVMRSKTCRDEGPSSFSDETFTTCIEVEMLAGRADIEDDVVVCCRDDEAYGLAPLGGGGGVRGGCRLKEGRGFEVVDAGIEATEGATAVGRGAAGTGGVGVA